VRFWYSQGEHDYVEVTIDEKARAALWRQRVKALVSTAEEERAFIERTAPLLDRLGRIQCQEDGVKPYSGYGSFPIATAAGRNAASILSEMSGSGLLLLHRPDKVFTLHCSRFIDNGDGEWALHLWPRGAHTDAVVEGWDT